MDTVQCRKNISCIMNVNNLTLCSVENNTCVEGHGYCVFNEKIIPRCICLPCFTGKYCEEESVSKNLWSVFAPTHEVAPNATLTIMTVVFGAFLLFNGVLCLQTYLCRKIRKTNLGIYLIMQSIVSIFIGLIQLIFSSITLHVQELPKPYLYLFHDLYCLIYQKFVYAPLVSMYNWFIASVAIERMLVVCFRNYGLHDSRCRSVISSVVIVIICPLTTLPGVFTVRKNQSSNLRSVQCVNFTPTGYILYATITCIHLFAFYFIYIVMNTVVLGHLLGHRRRFVDSDSLSAQVCLILHKHKDFFIPYLIRALGTLPVTLLDLIMTCPTANTRRGARVILVFSALQIAPFLITFYLYIYLSPVYWSEFWDSSPIGKCLMKVKKKLQPVYNNRIINNNNLLETHV